MDPFNEDRTMLGGVRTTAGFIPHWRIGNIDCPVMIENNKAQKKIPAPQLVRGCLAYALPGGGRVLGHRLNMAA